MITANRPNHSWEPRPGFCVVVLTMMTPLGTVFKRAGFENQKEKLFLSTLELDILALKVLPYWD